MFIQPQYRLQVPLGADELEARLRAIGKERYHALHPFQIKLQEGELTKQQVQAWALNRYYYQAMIPIKDASILARIPDAELRRQWRQRIIDHDGEDEQSGGIYRWLKLTDALGFKRNDVIEAGLILPATRFAVDAYVHFVKERSLLEAIASSLTEMFSPGIIKIRTAGMLQHYDFISEEALAYFTPRPEQATRDVKCALNYVRTHALTVEQQQNVLQTLHFKCDVLWSMLDALHYSYVEPGLIPPDAFDPKSYFNDANC